MHLFADVTCSGNVTHQLFEDPDFTVLQERVSAEFREMPGLVLTTAQTARLFNLDAGRCESVLSALVALRVLATNGRTFALADAGPAAPDGSWPWRNPA